MLATIRSVSKPVLAFKVLGAGRLSDTQESVKSAFLDAYTNIKPGDGVIVGLFPKRFDQVAMDLAYAESACAAAAARGTAG